MSVLNRKVWREFRELDQFDDATCRRIIDVIRQRRRGPRVVAELTSGAGCIVAFFVPLTLVYVAVPLIDLSRSVFKHWLFPTLMAMPIVLLVAAPVFGLMIYDRWLRRELAIIISGGTCLRCGYSLAHLPETMGRITCPECGASHDRHDLLHNLDIEVPMVRRDEFGRPVGDEKRGKGPHGPMG